MATPIPPTQLLEAYRRGIFPMTMPDGGVKWFSPNPRGIIPLDERFHVPHTTARALKNPAWEIRINTCFEEVMRACAARRETWIDEMMIASYCELHYLGYAHSVEVWRNGSLAGGLYGVALKSAFFGESMFHHISEASKIALVRLVEILRAGGFLLLDTQWTTPHLYRFGAMEVSQSTYLELLLESQQMPAKFTWPLEPKSPQGL